MNRHKNKNQDRFKRVKMGRLLAPLFASCCLYMPMDMVIAHSVDKTDVVHGADKASMVQSPIANLGRNRPAPFNGCSPEQQNTLVQTVSETEWALQDSISKLDDLPEEYRSASPRLVEYFGRYEPERYKTARDTLGKIQQVVTGESITFDCTCELEFQTLGTVIAYIGGIPYDIYVCPLMFSIGPAERIEILVHEISHFENIAGTRDFYRSGLFATTLAKSAPTFATENADNYGEFIGDPNANGIPIVTDGTPIPPPEFESPPDNTEFSSTRPVLLEVEQVVENILTTQAVRYEFQGTRFILLTSERNKNSDLYVYEGAPAVAESLSPDALVCASTAVSDPSLPGYDVCEVSPDTTYTALVVPTGSERMQYGIVATNNVPGGGAGALGNSTFISLNVSQKAEITVEDIHSYSVVGGSEVRVSVIEGDLNLSVIENTTPVSTTLCSKDVSATGNPVATCELPKGKNLGILVSTPTSELGEVVTYEILVTGADTTDDSSDDSGSTDSGSNDSGSNDSGSNDSGSNDSGSNDSGSNDSGSNDSGSNDSGSNDSGSTDSSSNDSGSDEMTTANDTAKVGGGGTGILWLAVSTLCLLTRRRDAVLSRGSATPPSET